MVVVGEQGVVGGTNHLLLTTILPLTLGKGKEKEGCKEQRQVGETGKHLKRQWSTGVLRQLLWQDMTWNSCATLPHHDSIGALSFLAALAALYLTLVTDSVSE